MPYEGKGRGESYAWKGISEESLEDAIKAAVGASDVEDGTMLVVTRIEVRTKGDPNAGEYHATVTRG